MEFEIKDGVGLIYIGNYYEGFYLCFKTPICIRWQSGDESYYLATLPHHRKYQESLFNPIKEELYQDFTGNEQALYKVLQPVLNQFANGKYSLEFINGESEYHPIYLSDTEITQFYSASEINQNTQNLSTDTLDREVDYTSLENLQKPHWYVGTNDDTVATIPSLDIDSERITFYENEIKSGKRPFAILLHEYDSPYFVLDGHHKIRAYYNLNIIPPVAVLTAYSAAEHLKDKLDARTVADLEYLYNIMHASHLRYFLKPFFWSSSNYFLEIIKKKNISLHVKLIKLHKKFKEIEDREEAKRMRQYKIEEKRRKAIFDKEQKEFEKRNAGDIYSRNLTGKEILRVIAIIILALLLILSITGF